MKTVKLLYGVIGATNGMCIAQLINYKVGTRIVNASKLSIFNILDVKCTEQLYLTMYGTLAALAFIATIVALKYHKELETIDN